jgi:hypothetical protein
MLSAAEQIVKGLVRSGRADPRATRCGDLLRLACLAGTGGFYWVSEAGELRRGRSLLDAETLAPGFVTAMRKLGGWIERVRARPAI